MRPFLHPTAAALAFALASVVAHAVPLGSSTTYQGRLTDAGVPANGLYDLELCLFDTAAAANALVCAAPFNDVPVADGLFTIAPDFGAAAFVGEQRWLELRVRAGADSGAYTALSPRQLLRAAPEALRAASASAAPWSGLTGVPAGFADGIDNGGSGTVTSVASGFGLSGGPITASGTLAVDTNAIQRRVGGTCTSVQAMRGVNADGTVTCGPDANSGGTLTSVVAGTGLSGGTITGSGTIAIADGGVGLAQIDTAQVQRRVSGTCSTGSTVSAINADGSVTCAADPLRAFTNVLTTQGNGGGDLSVAVRANDEPLIAYHAPGTAGSGALKVLDCANTFCSFGAERVVDPGGNVGWETRIALRSDGRPVIAYHDIANRALKLAVCSTLDCSGAATITTVSDHPSDVVGFYIDLVITAGDRPALSWARFTSDFASGSVQYLRCSNGDCSGAQAPVTLTTARVRSFTGLVIASGAFPQVVYDREGASPTIEVVLCADIACSAVSQVNTAATLAPGPAGQGAGVGSTPGGLIAVSYYDGANGDLRLLFCVNFGCPNGANGVSDRAVATAGNVGWRSALVVGEGDLPLIYYYDATNLQYRVIRCHNFACGSSGPPVTLANSPWAQTIGGENTLDIVLDNRARPFAAAVALSATDVNMRATRCESQDCR